MSKKDDQNKKETERLIAQAEKGIIDDSDIDNNKMYQKDQE